MKVIVWQEIECGGDLFEESWTSFAGTPHEVDLDFNDFTVIDSPQHAYSDSFKDALKELGYADALLPRGAGNADTAFYALDTSDYYSDDIVRVALIDAE